MGNGPVGEVSKDILIRGNGPIGEVSREVGLWGYVINMVA